MDIFCWKLAYFVSFRGIRKYIIPFFKLEGGPQIRQIFSGGIRPKWKFGWTKMKNWLENFSRASGVQKRGSQIFRLRRAFFVVEALKTAKKPFKTAKNR